ncbi:MAG TPA: MobF family relaxase [Candidatus Angelobacter sp.]|nr:MobF family relaxase [Candidatus Angelobacter sp.]
MISIGNVVSAGAAVRYFEEALAADSLHQYLSERDQAVAVWRGGGAGALGLTGRVELEHFKRVLDGCDPTSGEPLGRHHATLKNVAFDVTYSLPKSVSLLYALGDTPVRAAVLRSLHAGAEAAHDYLERHAGWGRAYNQETKTVERVRAEFVSAAFTHRTARPVTRDGVTLVDPQLHVHLIVASFVSRANGTWGQLFSSPLYDHAAAAGAIGQAVTRDLLVRLLGVRVRVNPNGTFELEGFELPQLAEFSRRHHQALAMAAAVGATGLHGTKVAVLSSREGKQHSDSGGDVVVEWRERAAAVGLTHEAITALLDQEQVRELRWFDAETFDQILGRGEGGLTARASVFTRRDLIRSLAAHTPLGIQPEPIEHLADAILAEPSAVTPMVPPGEAGEAPDAATRRWRERGMEMHYSTPEIVALEAAAAASAQARRGEGTAVLSPAVVARAIKHSGKRLTADQRAVIHTVCQSPDGVVAVEGAAGTGKTTAAGVIRQAFASQDVPIVGCALSGRATVGLQQEAGIPSFTTASLLFQLQTMGSHLAPGGVVVADECSMMGPDLASLVLLAERDGAKLVLVGDHHQHQPLDGGALFRSLSDRIGRVEMTEVIRQREQWDREVLTAFRVGMTAPLVRRYLEEGRVHRQPDEVARIGTMAADWIAATCDGHDVIAVARERSVVAGLNAVTREAAVTAGLVAPTGVRRGCLDNVGHTPVSLGELDFAIGDRVLVVGRNKRRLGLVKGLRGTVVGTRPDTTLVLRVSDRHPDIVVPPEYDGICHGYALTGHRALGATADIALVHGSSAADRQWHYVTLSRHRIRVAYYDVEPPGPDVDGVHHGEEQSARAEEESARATEKRLVRTMSRDGSKATTLDYPDEYDRQLIHEHAASGPEGGVSAPPTETQLDLLRDHGLVDTLPADATWVHASLLIDRVLGTPVGAQACEWLVEAGVPADEASQVIDVARDDLARGPLRRGRPSAAAPSPRTAHGRTEVQRSRETHSRDHDRRERQQREQLRRRNPG